MAKSRLSLVALALCAAGMLGACDNGEDEAAQGEAGEAAEAMPLTGVLDRSRAGSDIPPLVFSDPDGETLELAEVEGPVLVNLWATWCAPCVVEMPLLDELAADLDGEVQVLTVSVDLRGAEVVEPFFEARDLDNLTRWMDPENRTTFFYDTDVLPQTILYDSEGREVWRMIGAYDWTTAAAREEVLEATEPPDGAGEGAAG
ncbi:MAG: TlpA disulfide reductase family protein [Alteraurantiacibacter sp.]